MKKIALVFLGRKGGGPVYSLEIAKRLQEKADVLCVVSRQVENLACWQREITKLLVIETYSNKREFLLSFLGFNDFKKIKKAIRDFSPEVLYYPFFHFWLVLINQWFKNIPKVYTSHDPLLHSGERSWLTALLQSRLIKQSKRVIILSKAFQKVIQQKGVSDESIDVIPHGIFDYYLAVGPLSARKNNKPTLLFFGRIVAYKGLDVLLKAWPLVLSRLPQARLIIAGSGDLGPYQSLLNQPGLEIINRWINDQEIAGIFQKSDVLVCPYRDASQSGAVPTAYAFKIPVVASDTGGLSEQVQHRYSGLLVKVGQEKELALACLELLQSPGLRTQLGCNGFQIATTQWSWDKIGQQVFLSLSKVINA